jgi:hypothetical protein
MSTFLTQKGNLGLKKLTRDQIVEILPPPITQESVASDLGMLPRMCSLWSFSIVTRATLLSFSASAAGAG